MGLDNMPIDCCPYPFPGIPPHLNLVFLDQSEAAIKFKFIKHKNQSSLNGCFSLR